jgi:ABC-2 type transport system permease protein
MAAVTARPQGGTGLFWVLRDSWTVARRHLTHIRYMPEKLIDATIQPLIFVFMFAYIFGSAIVVPGGHYRDFLMPGIFVQSMAFASMTIMVGIVHGMQTGIMDRFRSLPMARAAVLIGHTGASLIEGALSIAVMAAAGLVVGWRPHLGLVHMLGGFGLLLLFTFAMSWLGAFLGLWLRSVEAAQGFGMIVMFPLTFVANTFVPTQGMPTWLRLVANWNPTSAVVAALRGIWSDGASTSLAAGAWPLQHAVPAALAYSGLMIALFLPLAVWRFRRAMAR